MIILYGPPGAGKSIQGQLLAAKNGWAFLSMGQLLRDKRDPQLLALMQTGSLAPNDVTYDVFLSAIEQVKNTEHAVLDGFPRQLVQAEWLLNNQPLGHYEVKQVLVLTVPIDEIIKRLKLRGRLDDSPQAIADRVAIYNQETNPILEFFVSRGIKVSQIDGLGDIEEIHKRVVEAIG